MDIQRKIIEELKRFNQINNYILNEQTPTTPTTPATPTDLPVDDLSTAPTVPSEPTVDASSTLPSVDSTQPTPVPEPVDVDNDPDVEEIKNDEDKNGETEEIDITDLITTQEEIKTKQDEFMEGMFKKLDDLESKLINMDQIIDKINNLEVKLDKTREKTPEEKLMLRSLDSYPYTQKLSDFFDDKKDEMEKTGKNEYILTTDDVEDASPNEIKKTFNIYDDDDDNDDYNI